MKKSILIICTILTTFSLMAFGYINWNHNKNNDLDLAYIVDSRFMTTITKEDLHNATSVLDIVPKKATGWWKVDFQTITIAILQDGNEITEIGEEKTLNAAQIKLLKSTDYSTNIYIKARTKNIYSETGRIEDFVYYITIIPEKEAEYVSGHDALIKYLKENLKEKTAIIKEDKLQPGRVYFTITKEGGIVDVKLSSTCGYSSIDELIVALITNMPEKWQPAENSIGEKVDQEYVFFFGTAGC